MVNKEWARMLSWRACYSLVVFIERYGIVVVIQD